MHPQDKKDMLSRDINDRRRMVIGSKGRPRCNASEPGYSSSLFISCKPFAFMNVDKYHILR
jgi:hypothetical protein